MDETPKFIALLKVKRRKSEKKKKSSFKVCRQCVDPSPKKNTGHRCVFDDPLIQWDHPPGRTKIATRLILGSVYSLNPSFCYFQTENDESKMTTKSMQQLPRGSVFFIAEEDLRHLVLIFLNDLFMNLLWVFVASTT